MRKVDAIKKHHNKKINNNYIYDILDRQIDRVTMLSLVGR